MVSWSTRVLTALLCCAPALAFGPITVSSVELMGAPAPATFETRAGEPFDPAKLRNDVKSLWRTGRFSDVRAETLDDAGSVRIVFRVQPKHSPRLRRIVVKPPTPGINPEVKEGAPIDTLGAHQIGEAVRKQLEVSGYPSAKVETSLIPVGTDQTDVEVRINQGQLVRIDNVELAGDLGEPGRRARKALKATPSKTMLPGVPGIWGGWRIRPGFSESAVQVDTENLRSFYYRHGYFDAAVQPSGTNRIRFDIQAGPRYSIREFLLRGHTGEYRIQPADGKFPVRDVCNALLDERRKAERAGVLDFRARIEVTPAGEDRRVDLVSTIERGPGYRIGRIEFRGNHSFSDLTVRRGLLINEGEPLDETLLRKSLARINQTGLFEPLSQNDVVVNTPPGSEVADVTIRLREKKARHWYFSGPVGPMSIGGPLQLAIGSRLPPWGRHVLELSTYTVSMNFMLFAKPLGSILPGFPNKRFIPMLTLQRPALPGQRWISGFTMTPQFGWQGMTTSYGISQVRGLLSGVFESPRAYTPVLPVTIARAGGGPGMREGTMFCEPQKTALDRLRQVGGMTTGIALSFLPF